MKSHLQRVGKHTVHKQNKWYIWMYTTNCQKTSSMQQITKKNNIKWQLIQNLVVTNMILNPVNLRCLSCEAFFFFKKVCTHRQVESLFFLRRRNMLFDALRSYINCFFCFSDQDHVSSHWPAAWNQNLPWGQFHSQRHPDALLWATG